MFLKETLDDFCPSIKVGDALFVWVFFSSPEDGDVPREWRVSVWGEDDCGFEKHFSDKLSAHREIMAITELSNISFDWLIENGYSSA